MSERLRLLLLGGVEVQGPENSLTPAHTKRIALITTVALSGPTPITRDKLLGRLWPDSPEDRARHALSNALYGIRKELGAEVIRSVGQALELDGEAIVVDALEFEEAIGQGHLEKAAELYRGPLLDGFYVGSSSEFEHWLHGQRDRLAALYGQTLEQLAVRAEAAGDTAGAVEWWRRVAGHDRYSSRVALGLVRALARAGDRAAALRHAEDHERSLREDLGFEAGDADETGPSFVQQVHRELTREGFGDLEELEFATPVEGTPSERGEAVLASGVGAPRRSPRWARRPVIGLAGLASVAVIGWVLTGALGPPPPDTPMLVVLADFEDQTGDPGLSLTVTEAFRIDLTRATRLSLLSPDRVRAGLSQMGLDRDARLARNNASELAQRVGASAVFTGSLRGVGEGYVLIAHLRDPRTGAVLGDAAFRESASSADDLIPAIARLAQSVLEHADNREPGRAAPAPLEPVTTRSLAALRLYSEAQRLSATVGAIQRIKDLLTEAVSLDSTFAGAHLQLGLWHWGSGQLSLARESLATAYKLKQRLTPAERATLEAEHRILFEGDLRGGIAAYEALLVDFPDDVRAHSRIGESYAWLRDWESAENHFGQATKIDPDCYPAWAQLYTNQWRQGKELEQRATLAEIEARFPNDARVAPLRGLILSSEGRFAEAEALFRSLDQQASRGPTLQARVIRASGTLFAIQGRLAEADIEYRRASEFFREGGSPRDGLNTAAARAYLRMAVAADHDGARAILEEALAQNPLDSLAPLDRPYLDLAIAEASLGDLDAARAILEEALAQNPLDSLAPLDRPYLDLAIAEASLGDLDAARALMAAHEAIEDPGLARWLPPNPGAMPFEAEPMKHLAYGVIDLASYNIDSAISHLRQSVATSSCTICGLPQLAIALEHRGETKREIDVYESFLETRWFGRIQAPPSEVADGVFRGIALQRVATLHDVAGHRSEAMKYYRDLAALWENADQELQPRVEKALARVRLLENGADPLELRSDGYYLERP